MIGRAPRQSKTARENRRLFGIGAMVGLALNLCFTPLFESSSVHAQQPSIDVVTVQRTIDGIQAGALAPVNADSPDQLQQQSVIYATLFGQPLEGAGSYYDLDVFPGQGDVCAAVNIENETPVTLEAVAVIPIDFAGIDFTTLGLTEEELEIHAQSAPVSNMVVGRLISDLGEATFVGMSASWAPVDGVQFPPMLKILGDVTGFFGAGVEPEDFVVGLGRAFVEQAQAAAGVTCPDGRVVAPDAQYNTCMGNADITLQHCLINVAIIVAACIAAAVAVQVIRMIGCKRLWVPWAIKACLAVLATWLALQIAACIVASVAGAAQCANDYIRDRRICANNLCGRTPVVTPGPGTPVGPVEPAPKQLHDELDNGGDLSHQ